MRLSEAQTPDGYQWLTTAPSPYRKVHALNVDAGRVGWKLHAVKASPDQSFDEIKYEPALCGMRPAHGYDLDMFIVDRCKRCEAAISRAALQESSDAD